jgi:hypothetical protein
LQVAVVAVVVLHKTTLVEALALVDFVLLHLNHLLLQVTQ